MPSGAAIAGLLHDVLEDCGMHHEPIIRERFGNRVAEIVHSCTDGMPNAKGEKRDWRQRTVWNRTVAVFDLKSAPSGCDRAYAWSYELENGERRFFAVLHTGPIDSPAAAVRAAIVAEARARE